MRLPYFPLVGATNGSGGGCRSYPRLPFQEFLGCRDELRDMTVSSFLRGEHIPCGMAKASRRGEAVCGSAKQALLTEHTGARA